MLTDRDSFMIISGGVNIYPREIENALVEHPKVLDACVIGLPDNELGEIVTAVIDPGAEVDGDDALATELLDYLRERIASASCPAGSNSPTAFPARRPESSSNAR